MSMSFKIENSRVFVKIQNCLKINIQVPIGLHNRYCKFKLDQTSSSPVPSI